MLELKGVNTSYGQSQVLFDLEMQIDAGEVATLMGRNGMGKTTTVRSIMGLTPAHAGTVTFEGRDITGLAAHQIAKIGIGLVPEGRQIFPNLSVRENLVATADNRSGKAEARWSLKRVLELFPRLAERGSNMGNQLSGGEQQMLAIGRALMTNPRLLILDEATEGLAPMIRAEIWQCLEGLKSEGQSILVIDKNVDALKKLANKHFIIEKGRVVWSGSTSDFEGQPELLERFLGV